MTNDNADDRVSVPRVTPRDRTTSIDDGMAFEPGRLSYAAARGVAAAVGAAVASVIGTGPVVIASDGFLVDLANLSAAIAQLNALREDYRHVATTLGPAVLHPDTPPAAIAPAVSATIPLFGTGLHNALGAISLLREDFDFRGAHTRIEPRSFEIAVAASLGPTVEVVLPDLTPIRKPLEGEHSLLDRLRVMQQARHDAWRAIGPLLAELGRTDAELDAVSRSGPADRLEALSRKTFELRKVVEPRTETLSSADRRLSDLQAQWDKPDASGSPLMARMLRAEFLDARKPHYLNVAVVASGGHHRVSRHLFRMLFAGDGLSAIGGVVVRWALIGPNGQFLRADIVADRRAATYPSVRTRLLAHVRRDTAREPK